MSKQLINQYYNQLDNLKRVGVTNEMAIKQPFDNLLLNLTSAKHYIYATEVTIKNDAGKNIRPDGILMNEFRIHKGFVESKDTNDTLDDEINKKLFKDGYPKSNIIFQDSIFAVLFQNGIEVSRVEMADANKLEKILIEFINYVPEYIEKFNAALEKFKQDIPVIVNTLREIIDEEHTKNKKFIAGFELFFEMCQQEINPQIAKEDIREMIIQHILTEDIFKSIFNEADFHHENNIAQQLENLVNTFMTRSMRLNQLSEINHYYETINTQASLVADHQEKQKFLKIVYENFYKMYNPKGADKLGVVYTPNEIVRFMVQSTDFVLQTHFNKQLADENVHILDPATGTGTFITDIIDFIPEQYLEYKYLNEIFANEVAILPYYIANLNIEYTYKQKMRKYIEFPNICFVDTLDNIDGLTYTGKQHSFGFSTENAERIQRQNEQKISVIIGNPPYNANQANFNNFNKNREYEFIDKRIKETYVKYSTAQKTKSYNPYKKFYRWASDRIDENGVICFVTDSGFLNKKSDDGFRKAIEKEFDFCYIIDLGGDLRELSGKDGISLGEPHTIFGMGAMVGIAIMFLVKTKEKVNDKCQIKYIHPCDIRATRIEKFDWLKSARFFNKIAFETITPDKNNNWLQLTENDFENLISIGDKNVKLGKSKNAIFKLYTNGIATNRDEWVYDFNKKNLEKKSDFLVKTYNESVKKNELITSIKWSDTLKDSLNKKIKSKLIKKKIIQSEYRPFIKNYYYSEKFFSDRLTQNHYDIYGPNLDKENIEIKFAFNEQTPLVLLAVNKISDLNFCARGGAGFPLYKYDQEGNKHFNITDWGLSQFTTHYQDNKITKEDIFYYTYAVLHNPEYRKKYESNLKRDFPRLPFYDDFFHWVSCGKKLINLHINYESVKPFDLKIVDNSANKDKNYKSKVKLKADKINNIIAIDEFTYLYNIPETAWDYKLGNRCALDWILDQYKEKNISDKTIAENFNPYQFADYKEEVIDLLKKVCTLSVETMNIIKEMENL